MKSLLKWTLVLTGLMPLIYSAGSLFPYIFPKALYFRGLVFLAVIFFCMVCFTQKDFLHEMIRKVKGLWKNSVFKLMTLMYASLILSTIFAFDRYMAMFGNIEREEGFVGLFFFYIFFVLIALVFQKKDWMRFFAVNLFTGGILFLVELSQSLGDNIARPGSLTDNPIFLATYYLFVLFSAIVLYRAGEVKNNMTVKFMSIFSMIITFIGIFLTETRGTLLGMFTGGCVVLVYFGFRGKNIPIGKNLSSRKLTVIALVLFGIFMGTFVATRHAEVWKNVPGFNRSAQISSQDSTTQARFTNASIALRAVNPKEATIVRTLFGWGWDNYIYAWQSFYNPRLFAYDPSLFDRAHDKLIDVLLMTGICGLVLYLGLWFFFFKEAFNRQKGFSAETALFVFWGIAFFLQNLTVFDTLVTFITFYAAFAYLIYETTTNTK